MFSKLKQFKDLRDKAKTIQAALAEERSEGVAARGKVKIVIDGNQKVISVFIDPGMMGDVEALQNAIREAINDAMEKMQKVLAHKVKDLGGLDLAQDMQDMMKR